MSKNDINVAINLLNKKRYIVLVPHRNPDGDAMGAVLGLFAFLKKIGHKISIITPNEFPNFLAWLPDISKVKIFEKEKKKTTEMLHKAELIFTLDFNALHRTGTQMENVLKELKTPFLMIDHHENPSDYATYMFSDTNYGSTCEMIYHFIDKLGYSDKIDKQIATCLYTGIVTDSGSFKYPKTTSTTHRIVANLLDKGIENTKIHNLLFDNNSQDKLKLLGKALGNLKIFPELKTAYIWLSQSDLVAFNFQKGDTEGIVNYPLTIKGIVFSVIFIENYNEQIIKMSFRSQGDFDVNVFAQKYFNGGGHKNAAGGRSERNLTQSIDDFLKAIEQDNPTKSSIMKLNTDLPKSN